MGLISFLLLCIVVGVICWLAVNYVPMPPEFKTAIPVFALVILVLILIVSVLGIGHDVVIPRLR
jgi:hypothetical protein